MGLAISLDARNRVGYISIAVNDVTLIDEDGRDLGDPGMPRVDDLLIRGRELRTNSAVSKPFVHLRGCFLRVNWQALR